MGARRLFDGAQAELGLLPLEGAEAITGTVAVTSANDAVSTAWGYAQGYRANVWDESKIEALDDGYWSKAACSVTPNTDAPPSGLSSTSDGDTFVENTGTSDHFVYRQPTLNAGQRYVISAFVKRLPGGRDGCGLFSSGAGAKFDLANLVTANTGSRYNGSGILDVGDDWRLCWVNFDVDTTTTYTAGLNSMESYAGSGYYTGDGRDCFAVWGMKLEAVDADTDGPSPLEDAGAGAITGTVAVTTASDTSAASGSPVVVGESGTTNEGDTSAASGSPVVAGTSTTTNAGDDASAGGSPVIVGTSATTSAGEAATASGSPVVTGDVAASDADDTPSASGSVGGDVAGTVAVTGENDASSAAGSPIVVASSAATSAAHVSTASGTTSIVGTSATVDEADISTASGSPVVVATSSTTSDAHASTATGSPVIASTAAATDEDDTASAAGSVGDEVSGTVAVTQDAHTSTASGTTSVTGTASTLDAADTSTATGSPVLVGTSAPVGAGDTATATGTGVLVGTSATTWATHAGAGAGSPIITGSVAALEVDDVCAADGIGAAAFVRSLIVIVESDAPHVRAELDARVRAARTGDVRAEARRGTMAIVSAHRTRIEP